MATMEDRVKALEDGFEVVAHDIVGAMNRQDILLREHGRTLDELKLRLGVVEAHMGSVDVRLNHMDERLEEFRAETRSKFEQIDRKFERMDRRFEQMDRKLDQIIAFLFQGKDS